MAVRIADRAIVDEIIRIERKYTKTGDTDLLGTKNQLAIDLSEKVFGNPYRWTALSDAIGAAVGPQGIMPNASNRQIYDILKAYGIDVRDGESHDA